MKTFGMAECDPLTIMEQNLKLTSTEGNEFEDATKYKKLVGSLKNLSRHFICYWNPLQVYAKAL